MNTITDTTLLVQNFTSFDDITRRAIYQEANENQDVDLVRQLNELGMTPNLPSFSGPTILSKFMDIATKHDIILHFLKELRKTNRLLTESEFQSLSSKKWFKKTQLSRILGCDHLMQKIRENKLKHIKVPLKIAVVEKTESLKVSGWDASDNLYEVNSNQIKIFAEIITSVDRKLSREEIDEIIQVIATSNFVDMCPANIVVAEDGVYFIDTEFKSFAGSIMWYKMGRFMSLINEDDQAYFKERIEEKIKEPSTKKKEYNYDELKNNLRMFEELSPSLIETNRGIIEECKNKILSLEYVGTKKVGKDWSTPNEFSFNLREIIT
ncbi:MAG: hypothetical protein VX777_10920 [Chlamydiota bacterium]|nr:hypothetical protein [Chlamydiota bacterium]